MLISNSYICINDNLNSAWKDKGPVMFIQGSGNKFKESAGYVVNISNSASHKIRETSAMDTAN